MMKNMYWFVVMGLLFSGCVSSNAALSKQDIEAKVVGHSLYNNDEEFLIFDNGTFIYKDKETNKKRRGTWYLRSSLVDYKGNRKDDMLCLAIGKKSTEQFSIAPCFRLFHEDDPHGYDNLYTNVSADCNVRDIDKGGNVKCDFTDRIFMKHRISEKKFYDE
jgi:hypothetical protein